MGCGDRCQVALGRARPELFPLETELGCEVCEVELDLLRIGGKRNETVRFAELFPTRPIRLVSAARIQRFPLLCQLRGSQL